MARTASKFKVGIFVIVGLALGMGALVYLGVGRKSNDAEHYVTYFSESVQGLSRDSVVKYLGVDVGRVTGIGVAPDNKLIEVEVEVKIAGGIDQNMVAQLRSAGLTGITFIELYRTKPGDADLSPQLSFASEYPIIPSHPSKLTHIFSVVEKIARELEQVNFKAMAQDMRGAFSAARNLFASPELQNALVSLKGASGKLETIVARLDRDMQEADIPKLATLVQSAVQNGEAMMSQGKEAMGEGKKVMVRAGDAVEAVQDLIAELQLELKAVDLPARSRQTGELIDTANHQISELMTRLVSTADQLDAASRSLDRLLRRVEKNPSEMIWSSNPKPRKID
jgi:phospholipid/cholesterol/gamma-HCH transport system substrate-binding protein